MVTRSRAREDRGIPVDPEVEFRPETEIQQEIEKQTVSTSATCERVFLSTISSISDTASQYVTADRPEDTAAFPTSSQVITESHPELSETTQKPAFHTLVQYFVYCIVYLNHRSALYSYILCSGSEAYHI